MSKKEIIKYRKKGMSKKRFLHLDAVFEGRKEGERQRRKGKKKRHGQKMINRIFPMIFFSPFLSATDLH